MDADGGIDRFMAIRQADAGFEVGRTVARADDDHSLDAGGQGAVDDGLAVGVELGVVEMAVGVDHFTMSGLKAGPTLLQAGSDGDVFEEAGQHGIAAFKRRGDDHALRFQAA